MVIVDFAQIKRLPLTAQFMYRHTCICGTSIASVVEPGLQIKPISEGTLRDVLSPSACQRKQLNQRGWGLW
jgi:hypothetical protein